MPFINLSGVSLSYGDRDILLDMDLHLSGKSRIALTGANGSGKSTLMKIVSGLIRQDTGTVSTSDGAVIAYLPQEGLLHQGKTLREEVESAFMLYHEMEKNLRSIEHDLSLLNKNDRNISPLLEKHHSLHELLMESGFYQREEMCGQVLLGLGFDAVDFTRKCEDFSGGWQMKIALAKVLLQKPDFLLLDEPTNYLEIEARNWLEECIRTCRGGVLLVSHDKFFLDSTCNEVAELFNAKLLRYKGTYTHYEIQRNEELKALLERYRRQEEEIRKIEDFINRFRYNASKAALVQSRVKQLEKIVRIEIPESMKKIHFTFPEAPRCGKTVLSIQGLEKKYGNLTVFKGLDFEISRGEKIVIAGRNGTGKSTLMRIVSGKDPDFTGSLEYGAGVRTGYFSQEQGEMLKNGLSVLEEAEREAPPGMIPRLRSLLGAFLFRNDDIYKPVSALSGGEKSRLALLKLLLKPANFLVLDEPTNHLDINSKDILLEALSGYGGTLLFVSHDRYFIENLATRVLELGEHGPRNFPGDYAYYLWKIQKEADESSDAKPGNGSREGTVFSQSPKKAASQGKDFYESAKQQKNQLKKLIREEEELLVQILDLEQKHNSIQNEMALPGNYSNGGKIKTLQKALEQNEAAQHAAHSRWEKISKELELIS